MVYTSYEKLNRLLSDYVTEWSVPDITELDECLHAVTPQQRYELVAGVKSWFGDNVMYIAARFNNTEILDCILASFTPEVRYALLKQQKWVHGRTPLHKAAMQGQTEAIRCMLDMIPLEKKIQLVCIQDRTFKTALERAQPFQPAVEVLLLSMNGESHADVDIQQMKDEIVGLREQKHADAKKVKRLEVRVDEQDKENSELKAKIQNLENRVEEHDLSISHLNQLTLEQGEQIQGKADKIQCIASPSDAFGSLSIDSEQLPPPTIEAVQVFNDE